MNAGASSLWHSRSGRLAVLLIASAIAIIFSPLAQRYMTDITDIFSLGAMFGVLATGGPVAVATLLLYKRNESWRRFGLQRPDSWLKLAVQTALVTIATLLLFIFVVPPIAEMTGARPNLDHLAQLPGNLPGLIIALVIVWISAAFFEEMFVRGYLLNEIADLLGGKAAAVASAVILSSLVFGLGHLYQGASGVIVTGLTGLVLGIAYLLCGRNLWPLILAHGLVNSISLVRIYSMPAS